MYVRTLSGPEKQPYLREFFPTSNASILNLCQLILTFAGLAFGCDHYLVSHSRENGNKRGTSNTSLEKVMMMILAQC